MKPLKHPNTAFGLLIAGLLLSYCWYWAPAHIQSQVWDISNSVLVIGLLAIIAMIYDSTEMWAVTGLIGSFKAVVITCSTWYMIAPWEIKPGQAMCSAKLNVPLGIVGIAIGAMFITYFLARRKHG